MSKIRSINLKNFKCFKHGEIGLGDLTILAGLNGVGKSAAIQALLLLRQSFGIPDRPYAELKLNGELIRLGTAKDILSDLAEDDELSIGYEYEGRNGHLLRQEFKYKFDDGTNSLKFSTATLPPAGSQSDLDDDPFSAHNPKRIQYLSAERLGPREYLLSSEEHERLGQTGTKGEYVLGLLSDRRAIDQMKMDDPRLHAESNSPSLRSQVDAWLQEVSPGTSLNITDNSDISTQTARYSFKRPEGTSQPFKSTNVGFGISYVLPVLVSLLAARPGDLVIIENPETYLHPKGQTRLGKLAAQTAKAGVQVIIETHSDHFLDGVRIAVKNKVCDPKDVAIHYFTRFGPETRVISPELQEDGRLSEWPEGFFDEKGDNLVKLLAPSSGK